MCTQTAGEKAVSVCNLYKIVFAKSERGKATRYGLCPVVQILLGITYNDRLTGGA